MGVHGTKGRSGDNPGKIHRSKGVQCSGVSEAGGVEERGQQGVQQVSSGSDKDDRGARREENITVPALSPLSSTCSRPFHQLSVDLVTALPPSADYDSLLVVVDHSLLKGVILVPCNKTIDAKGVAKLFFKHIFLRFGLHDTLISDRGPQFTSAFATELARILGYNLKLSTTYHPQTDGET